MRALVAASVILCGCLPYSVASTAQTVPRGERRVTGTLWFMPGAIEAPGDTLGPSHGFRGMDTEARWGIDDRSDFGLRVPSASGVVLSYKRRILGAPHRDSAALSWQLGTGVVNLGEHAIAEQSVLVNLRRHGIATWYGGVRAMQVAPLSRDAVRDKPSVGALIGVELNIGGEIVIPEVAVYRDPSALGIRSTNVVIVPSISLRNLDLLRDLLRWTDRLSGR